MGRCWVFVAVVLLCALALASGGAGTTRAPSATALPADLAPLVRATLAADGMDAAPPLTPAFAPDGVRLGAGRVGWGMHLAAVGGQGVPTVAPITVGGRTEYRRGDVTEWYVGKGGRVEQGFTLAAPPADGLTLAVALDSATATGDSTLTVHTPAGDARYDGLAATDATGRMLPARMEADGNAITIKVDDAGAVYPVVVDPFIQQQKLTAGNGASFGYFGVGVSLSADGTTALVGADAENNFTGAAYIFTRSGGAWTVQQKLTAGDGEANDAFGSVSLSADGITALIGALGKNGNTGAAYVFTRSGTTWTQQAKLTASDGVTEDRFGGNVSLSGDGNTALIGAYLKDYNGVLNVGAAYVFTRTGSAWAQQQKLLPSSAAHNLFGLSVSLSGDGNTALIGAYGENSYAGAAYIFVRSGTMWAQQRNLAVNSYSFGLSVSLNGDGNTALIGAGGDSGKGEVYVFTRSGATWAQQAKLTANDAAASDFFGTSISLSRDGTSGIIGAYRKNGYAGAVYIFIRSGGMWSQQQELTASDAAANNNFGSGVSLSGDGAVALVGAPFNNSYAGAAYVFAYGTVNAAPPPRATPAPPAAATPNVGGHARPTVAPPATGTVNPGGTRR